MKERNKMKKPIILFKGKMVDPSFPPYSNVDFSLRHSALKKMEEVENPETTRERIETIRKHEQAKLWRYQLNSEYDTTARAIITACDALVI